MLAIDSTTRTAYDAASGASNKAQVVVDALGATVAVKIYDGGGNEKASGTMGSPWATQANGVISIGEVTSMAITAAGTPDANWYLRFEGNSRWLRGSFGLRSSAQDFVARGDAWVNGFTITLGTVQINAPSNTAPSLVGAPSTLSYLYGTGGTHDFSDYVSDPEGGPHAYALIGTAYSGITINASSGVLTVTAAAAVATRNLTIRVTDPTGLSSDWACAVTVAAASSASHIVYSNGQLNGGATHTTIAAAIAAMSAGDTLELRNATAGSLTVWAQALDFTGKAGTAIAPLTVRVRDGDQVVLRTSGTLLTLTNCSYLVIGGNTSGVTGLQIGDERDFVHTQAAWANCYPQTYGLNAANAHHWTVRNATLTGAQAYYCNSVAATCTDYEFRDCKFTRAGTNCFNNGNDDARNILLARGARARWVNCTADHGGHDTVAVHAASAVVRNCTFSGYWADLSPYAGSRACTSLGADNSNVGNGPQLWEGCTIRDSGESPGGGSMQALMKVETAHMILRGCYLLDSDSHIWHSNYTSQSESSPTTTQSISFHCFYHNTTYTTKGTWWNNNVSYSASYGADFYEKNRIQNNLFMACADGDKSTPSGGQVVSYDSRGVLDGYSNGWKGSLIQGNQFGGSSANFNLELKGDAGTTGVYPVDAPPANWSANVVSNRVSAVTFNAVGTAPHRSPAGFSVTNWGTGAAGDAPALATVTATTGTYAAGDWIEIDTARPFFSGWGITGEVGDYVVIGSTATGGVTRQIAACDYAGNRVQLTTSTTVTTGDGVWFAGNPANGAASVWDNRGAVQ